MQNNLKAYMMLGLPGSGKTTFSKRIAASQKLTRFSLDEDYFARVGNHQQKQRDEAIEKEVIADINARIQAELSQGKSVILDFCPWRAQDRVEYISWLRSLGAEPIVYYFDVPRDELLKRLENRNAQESSEHQYMTSEMLDDFYQRFDPPQPDEADTIITTTALKSYDALIVLGSTVNPDGSIPDKDIARLEKVAGLFHNHTVRAIVTCGAFGYKETIQPEISEAQAYANYLESLGVPRESLYLEQQSQETMGNILFTKTSILMKHGWHTILVIPTVHHSTERIAYILQKILGPEYSWDILRVGESNDSQVLQREAKALAMTKEINDPFLDGDHEAIHQGMLDTHPAYGGTKWTVDELRRELGK